MAKTSHLNSEWIDPETVKISWHDVKVREDGAGNQMMIALIGIGGFAFTAYQAFGQGNLIFLPIWLCALVGLIMFNSTKVTEPNSITIGKLETRHNGRVFQTNEITRFEMGKETALLGGVATKPAVAGGRVDQTIIRLWIDDASAYDLLRIPEYSAGHSDDIRPPQPGYPATCGASS